VKQRQNDLALGKPQKKRTLKDKERVLYAPFSNLGAINFEKTTGYITIPDHQVVYTKLDENGEVVGGDNAGNEGQKLVWGLQDLKSGLNEMDLEAPQLL